MSWGNRAWGDDVRVRDDASTPNRVGLLLNDPTARINIVLVANPRRLGSIGAGMFAWGGVKGWGGPYFTPDRNRVGKIYVSTRGLLTEPDDTPADTHMVAALQTGINFQAQIPLIGDPSRAQSSVGVSEISLNRETDYLANSAWAGTDIELKIGGKTGGSEIPFSEYETLLDGQAAGMDYDESTMRLELRDNTHRLNDTVQLSQYAGDGSDFEGGTNIEGQYKPRCFGDCFNLPGTPVGDQGNSPVTGFYFQFNDGQVSSIDAVRDNGVALTFDTNTTDLTSWTGASGQYATDLSRGLIAVWDEPDGQITADVKGHVFNDGYTDTAAIIIKRLLNELGVGVDPGEFTGVMQQSIGFYTDTNAMSYDDVIQQITSDLDGWIVGNRSGLMELGVHSDLLDSPAFIIEGRDEQDSPAVIESIERLDTPDLVYKVSVPYRRNWTVQGADGLDDAVSATNRNLYSTQLRRTDPATDATIQARFPDALEYEPSQGGFLVNAADADALRDGIAGRYNRHRDLFRLSVLRPRFQIFVGDIIKFFHDRFGLSVGAQGECVRVHEQDDITTIDVIAVRLSADTQ